jgi:hypothetical protein
MAESRKQYALPKAAAIGQVNELIQGPAKTRNTPRMIVKKKITKEPTAARKVKPGLIDL